MLPTSIDGVPPAPREPSPRARSLIFKAGPAPRILVIMGTIFALIGIPFVWAFCSGIPGDLAIDHDGSRVEGKLISDTLDLNVRVNNTHPHVLVFSYQRGGQGFTAQSSTIGPVPRAGPGGTLPLEVSNQHPHYARVAGTKRNWAGYFGLFTLFFPLAGIAMVLAGVWQSGRTKHAFIEGRPALAQVYDAGVNRNVRINGRNPYRVRWKFTVDNREYKGSLSAIDQSSIADLLEAKELVILYEEGSPSANTVYLDD